jgi:hypothetical protein
LRGGGRTMSMPAASRIQSATTRANGGQVSRGSFAARAQSAAAHNALTTAPLASSKGRN